VVFRGSLFFFSVVFFSFSLFPPIPLPPPPPFQRVPPGPLFGIARTMPQLFPENSASGVAPLSCIASQVVYVFFAIIFLFFLPPLRLSTFCCLTDPPFLPVKSTNNIWLVLNQPPTPPPPAPEPYKAPPPLLPAPPQHDSQLRVIGQHLCVVYHPFQSFPSPPCLVPVVTFCR